MVGIRRPTQSRPFEYSVTIRNLDRRVFPGARLKNFRFDSASGQTVCYTNEKEYQIPVLNPDAEFTIPLDRITLELEGLVWVKCSVHLTGATGDIRSFQYDPDNRKDIEFTDINEWGVEVAIVSQSAYQQRRTNLILVVLTLLMFVEAVFGIRNTCVFFIKGFGKMLAILAEWMVRQ